MSIIDKLNINNADSDYEFTDSKARTDISTINGKLTTDEASIKKNASDISSINTKLTTDETNIKKNTTDISSLNTASSKNASDLTAEITRAKAAEKVNSDNITTNKTNIAANKTNIDKNKASIDGLTSATTNHANSINNLTAMMNFCRTDKVYSVDIPKWSTTQAGTATKTDANAGLIAISEFGFENDCVVGASCGVSGSGDTKGVGDAVYISTGSAGNTRELRCLGDLWNWSPCGLCFLNLYNWLGYYGWYRRSQF